MILMLGVMALVMLAFVVAAVVLVARRIQVCAPDEVLVVSGRRGPGGSFTLVSGGRILPLPLLETVDHLSLAPVAVDLPIHSAPCRGGAEVSLRVSARVRVSHEPGLVHRAARLLLGLPRERVVLLASRVLQGAAREVLATLHRDELTSDPLLVRQRIHEHAAAPLQRLGLDCEHLSTEPKANS